jgi:hypothetical protein
VDIGGFNSLFPVELSYMTEEDFPRTDGHFFRLAKNSVTLEWYELKGEKRTRIAQFDLQPTLRLWWKKMEPDQDYSYTTFEPAERLINFSHARGSLRLVVNEAQLMSKNDSITISHCYGWLLLKEK